MYLLDNFESLEDEICEHTLTKPVLQRRGNFYFTADTCRVCGDFHWTANHEVAFQRFCESSDRRIQYLLPSQVDTYMRSIGIPDHVALNYFLSLWKDDSDILDFIDNEYTGIYEAGGWEVKSMNTSKNVVLTPYQFGCVTDLCDECGFDTRQMVGDLIGRTVATVMYLRPGPTYKKHRQNLLDRQKPWWK